MKKALLLIGVLVAANILLAQDRREVVKEKAEVRIEEFKTRLELTSEQEEQWKDLREKYRPELKSIKQDDSKSRSYKLRAVADVDDAREKELNAILSAKQMEELKVIRTEVRENVRKRRRMRMKRRSGN